MKKQLLSCLLVLASMCLGACNQNDSYIGGGGNTDDTPPVQFYTITWKNYDGTVLETDTDVPYGSTPSYDGSTPTKEGQAGHTCNFTGWSPTIATVTGDAIYTAEFDDVVNTYTITWKNYDGTVLETDENVSHGATPTYNGATPTRAADAHFTYTFSGWSPTIATVTGDAIYTATYSQTTNSYTVTWKNYDGTVLETDTNVPYGTIPTFNSAEPTKPADAQYSYTFTGWSPAITTVTGDATYTATFGTTVNTYTVTWKNYDGTVLETDTNVPYGDMPVYDGAAPVKSDDDQYTYTFSGWTPSLVTVTNNATYTATFTQQEKPSDYSIFEVSDGWAIEKYNGSESRITVPSSIKGHQIVEIAEKAFLGNTKLLSVALPNTIKRIGESAFDSCSRLYSINLPSSCVSVGKRCFAFTALTSITIPANLTSIGLNWLANCKLTKVTFLGSLNEEKFIGDYLNNIVNWNANFANGDNAVEEHFKATHEQTDWVYLSSGAYGNYFPTKEIYDWELLDTNRFLNAEVAVKDLVNDKNIYVQMKLFANGPESNFTISKSTEYSSYTASWGRTVSVETKTIRYISGKMHMSLDVLSEIVIPSSSTVSNETLLGMLENITVTRQ